MPRTNAAAVEAILLGAYGAADLTPFIDTAASLVRRVVACNARKGETQAEEDLELIERWLAAHAYAMTDQVASSSRTLSSGATFGGRLWMNLEATKYGQMALSLDGTGCLAAVASGRDRRTAGVSWLGKTEREQLTHEERN